MEQRKTTDIESLMNYADKRSDHKHTSKSVQ